MAKVKFLLALVAVVPFVIGGPVMASDMKGETASQLFETKCSKCHSADRPKGVTKDKEGWTATVKRMQGKSPDWISDEEASTIIDYLSKTYGKM